MKRPHIEDNKDIQRLHTFGVPWRSRFFCCIQNHKEAQQAGEYCRAQKKELFILGGGSNILPVHDYPGLVAKNEIAGREIISTGEHNVRVRVGAGENWDNLVRWSLQQGYHGLENLVCIPGTVGGAVVQNIGAYDVDIQRFVFRVEAISTVTLEQTEFTQQECEFAYRASIFKQNPGKWIITNVVLELDTSYTPVLSYKPLHQQLESQANKLTAEKVMRTVENIRRSKLPDWNTLGTAGSFFANPRVDINLAAWLRGLYPDMPVFNNYGSSECTIPAGWLIEHSHIDEDAKRRFLYEKHHLVVVNKDKNTSGTSGKDILKFVGHIQEQVCVVFGIDLKREVVIV